MLGEIVGCLGIQPGLQLAPSPLLSLSLSPLPRKREGGGREVGGKLGCPKQTGEAVGSRGQLLEEDAKGHVSFNLQVPGPGL